MRTLIAACLCALFLAPSVASAEFDNSVPWRNLSRSSPILITRASTFFNGDGTIRLCVSFRNVSNKAASRVRISFEFDDSFDRLMRDAVLPRSGTFGPGILIEGAMSVFGATGDALKNCVDRVAGTNSKPTIEKIDVTDVVFEDGTRWKKGDPFVRAFDNGGGSIVATTVGPTPAPSSAPGAATAVHVGGATGVAGTVGAAGTSFGAIAWIPGSRTAYGVSIDASSQDTADFAAMTKCTQFAQGVGGCKPIVRLFGTTNKCGAIATDGVRYSSAFGPDMSSTIQSVLQALAAAGGTIGADSVITSACNTN